MIDAPIKGFYTFHESAHSPIFEEPNLALNIFLQDILNLKVTLEDFLSSDFVIERPVSSE